MIKATPEQMEVIAADADVPTTMTSVRKRRQGYLQCQINAGNPNIEPSPRKAYFWAENWCNFGTVLRVQVFADLFKWRPGGLLDLRDSDQKVGGGG